MSGYPFEFDANVVMIERNRFFKCMRMIRSFEAQKIIIHALGYLFSSAGLGHDTSPTPRFLPLVPFA